RQPLPRGRGRLAQDARAREVSAVVVRHQQVCMSGDTATSIRSALARSTGTDAIFHFLSASAPASDAKRTSAPRVSDDTDGLPQKPSAAATASSAGSTEVA